MSDEAAEKDRAVSDATKQVDGADQRAVCAGLTVVVLTFAKKKR